MTKIQHNLPRLKNDWFSYSSHKAPVYKADTIEGLAKEAGLNPVELKKVVDEYNAALKAGKLGELTPPNTHKNPRPILKAPFYAVPFQGGMTATFGLVRSSIRTVRFLTRKDVRFRVSSQSATQQAVCSMTTTSAALS